MEPMARDRGRRGVGWLFLPSPWAWPFYALGLGWLLTVGTCAAVGTSRASDLGITLGILTVPVFATLLLIGGALGRSWVVRALVFWITLAVSGVGLLTFVFGAAVDSDPGQLAVGGFFYGGPMAIILLLAIFFTVRAVVEVRQTAAAARAERALQMVMARGEASFEEIAKETGLAVDLVDDAFDDLRQSGQFVGEIDMEAKMAYSAQGLAAKEQKLVSVVYGRGRVAVADLASELRVSTQRLRDLLHHAVAMGRFAGYVDWKRGVLFSADAHALQGQNQCPSCGGSMQLAGRGLFVCSYCGGEVFVS